MGRDGPGKKSRTNSHRLAEWPQSVCLTSWCIDLCGPMQRARVFSSLLYQDVMVFDVPEKDPAQPCKKPSPHKARRTPHGDLHPRRLRSFARATARVTKLWAPAAAPAAAPAFGKLVHAGGCGGGGGAFAQRVRPGRCRLTARVFAPQVRTMAAGAEGGRQVWACITTLRAGVRTELYIVHDDAMSGEPAAGRRPRDSSHSRPPQGSAKRGRPASKARTSCPVCKNAWKWCSVACAGRADAGRAATGVALGQGGQAPDAEDQASCGLVAGDGGAHPALQPAIPHVVDAARMLGRLLRLMHAGRQCMGAHRGSVSRNIRLFLSRRSSVLMWSRRRRNRDARSVTVGGVRLRV